MSVRYLEVEGTRAGEYYFLILCATLGMMFMAGGTDLITLFIGLETMAISFYILTGFLKPSRRSNEAAVKYFLLGAFSLGILLYGMSLMYGLSGTTNLRAIATALAGQESDPRLILAVILVVAGMGFKIAAVPFHMWAPDVYEGAPTPDHRLPVGRLEGGVVRDAAADFRREPSDDARVVVRERERWTPSGPDIGWGMMFYVLAVVTMTVGNFAALTQSNLKRMLAYSSIAHAGYLLIGVVAGTARGVTAMLVYLFVYAFMQLGAFAVLALMRRARRGRRRAEGSERAVLPPAVRRGGDAAVHAVARRHSADGGVHGEVLAVRRRDRIGVCVAGGDRRAEQRRVAVLLHPHRRLHDAEERAAGSEPRQSPALAFAMGVAVVATLLLGVYPQPLFEFAQASAATLGASADCPDIAVKTRQIQAEIDRSHAGELFHKVCYSQHARRHGFPRSVLPIFAGERPQIRTRSGRQLHTDWRHHPARRHRVRSR